jgi:thiamine biosynthesis lipoprotein
MQRVEHIMGIPIGIDIRDDVVVDLEPAFARLREADAVFSTYREDSDIRRLDRGEATLADVHPDVDAVLTACIDLNRDTDGYFSVRPAGRLDPSGFVKGWAVARAAGELAAAGARRFCINAGGDVIACGRPWRVGIRHPGHPDALAAVVEVEDLAVATSGEYERGAHILDPHTRTRPSGLQSVTIIGPDLALADAYATAAFAMGVDRGPAWTAALDRYEALCITDDGRMLSTAGFARYRAD